MPVEVFHPMVVHFPIALLLAAFLVETLALIFRKTAWHRIALWNLVLGTWGALAAVITGGISAVAAESPALEIGKTLNAHSLWGMIFFALAATVNAWHLAAGKEMKPKARWMAWGLLAVTCGVMAFASHLGARLVYQYGLVKVNLP